MMFEMRSVYSSHVEAIGYDPETRQLVVSFSKGRRRQAIYHDVPPEVADRVINAPSIGEALHEAVRGGYRHTYG